jgi:hypothetical protein
VKDGSFSLGEAGELIVHRGTPQLVRVYTADFPGDVTPLELEILRRNALLRAWREVGGVPRFEGKWSPSLWTDRQVFLGLYCEPCKCSVGGNVHAGEHWTPGYTRGRLKCVERREAERAKRLGCPHLAPLLSPPPPEVLAFAELTLMESTL